MKKKIRLFLVTIVILALVLVSIPQTTLVFAVSPTVPSAPTSLTAIPKDDDTGIVLSWTAPTSDGGSAITGYMIERSNDGGTTWNTIVANTGSTATMYEEECLPSHNTYTYRVSAINSVETSTPSNTSSTTTSGPFPPQPPTDFTATAVSSSQINLSWTAPSCNGGSAITGYKIERSDNGGFTWNAIVPNTRSIVTTYSGTGPSPSTTYTYRISTITAAGISIPLYL